MLPSFLDLQCFLLDHAHLTPGGGRPSKVSGDPTPKDVYKLLRVRGPTPKDVYKLLGVRGGPPQRMCMYKLLGVRGPTPKDVYKLLGVRGPAQRMCTHSRGTLGEIWEFYRLF